MEVLRLLVMFTGGPISQEYYVDTCYRARTHLSINKKIEMGIGCSTVNDRRAFRQSELLKILGEKR